MKKLLMSLVCLFALVALVACGQTDNDNTGNGENNGGETTPTGTTYKLGMGISVDSDLTKVQYSATVATVVVDKDGKIVACRLDVAQNTVGIEDGTVTAPTDLRSKMEKGADYGMAGNPWSSDNNGDEIILEWDVQAKLFEAYVVGLTGAEVAALETQNVHDHNISKDEELLTAGCTIDITAFQEAIAKACADEFAVEFTTDKTFTLGLAVESFVEAVSDYEDEENLATGKVYADFAASVVVEGKIAASLNDAIQPAFYNDLEETTFEYKGTKRELKEEYGMSGAIHYAPNLDADGDGEILEWYKQSALFSQYVVGLSGAEVAALTTEKNPINYDWSTDADLIAAGCTIQITAIRDVVAESVTNAR